MINVQCSNKVVKVQKSFNVCISNIDYVKIHKYESNSNQKTFEKTIIEKEYIYHLFNHYLLQNKREMSKFPKRYGITIFYTDGETENIIINDNYFKVNNKGVFKMKENIEEYLEIGLGVK